MARAALGWDGQQLANKARVALRTVRSFEAGRAVRPANAEGMRIALENEGIEFVKSGVKIAQKAS